MNPTPTSDDSTADDSPFALARFSEYLPHLCSMATQAGRRINIFSQDLDSSILDDDSFCDALRTFVVEHNRAAQVRILVQRPQTAIRQGHRLVELARKLSSFVEIRRPASQHASVADAFLTFDNSSYIHRELGDRPEGKACYQDSLRTLELNRRFDEIWAMAEPEPEFRRLGI